MNNFPRQVQLHDWSVRPYAEAWAAQEVIFNQTIADKIALRKTESSGLYPENHLILVEHPPVYTLGKSGNISNLLLSEAECAESGISFYRINRGGDITFHGPGQLVVYPILDLDQFFTDIHKYLRFLEEAVIEVLRPMGIIAGRVDGLTGVWLDGHLPEKARKICALGIKASRWVTMHGLAFNVSTDLNYFKHIIPCGIDDKQVTSISAELGTAIPMSQIKNSLVIALGQLFDWKLIT